MFIDIDGKDFYKLVTENPERFPDWVLEGHQIWNRRTGQIVSEEGAEWNDLVYRGPNWWENIYKDKDTKSFQAKDYGVETLTTMLDGECADNPEKYLTKAEINNQVVLSL